MAKKTRDYSVLDKFGFERKPVGVMFSITRPKGIKRIQNELNFCEMLKEAQEGNAFYVGPDDWVCVGVEQMILGMRDAESVLISGLLGGYDGLYKNASACRAMYQYLPSLPKNSIQYVAFASLDKLTFDPDVLIMTATIDQAAPLLRSINYSTGKPFQCKATPVVACAWMYIYPVVSGEMNFYVTGLGLGMQQLDIFPPGLFLISVPFQLIPTMLQNLNDMDFSPRLEPGPGGKAHRKRVNKILDDLKEKINK
jgi:uncharacterized protein (DUF169 family)